MRIKFDLIQLNPDQNSSISLPLAPQRPEYLFDLQVFIFFWVTNIYEKIINKHPLALTKNLTFLTKSNYITMLKKVMVHSSINVYLTYLRGLEMAELKQEDMPVV